MPTSSRPRIWNGWGGALAGDWNEDQTLGQMAVDIGVSLIPVVDQVADARDLAANLKKLIIDGRTNEAGVWLSTALTLVGCIPELGTIIKGVCKTVLNAVQSVTKVDLRKLLEVLIARLNDAGGIGGNAFRFLKELRANLTKHFNDALELLNRILDRAKSLVEHFKQLVSRKAAEAADALLARIRKVRELAPAKLKEVREKVDDWLGKAIKEDDKNKLLGSTDQVNTRGKSVDDIRGGKDPAAPEAGGGGGGSGDGGGKGGDGKGGDGKGGGPPGGRPLRTPSDRHYLGSLSVPKKSGNSVFVDVTKEQVRKDIDEINAGKATRHVGPSGEETFETSSGRVYSYHDDIAYPVRGPGIEELSSPQYNTLKNFQDHLKADPAKADAGLEKALDAQTKNGSMTAEQADKVRDLAKLMKDKKP